MLTAQEGRLQTDTDASLNTGGQAAPRRRIGVPRWPISEHSGAPAGVKTGGIAAILNRR